MLRRADHGVDWENYILLDDSDDTSSYSTKSLRRKAGSVKAAGRKPRVIHISDDSETDGEAAAPTPFGYQDCTGHIMVNSQHDNFRLSLLENCAISAPQTKQQLSSTSHTKALTHRKSSSKIPREMIQAVESDDLDVALSALTISDTKRSADIIAHERSESLLQDKESTESDYYSCSSNPWIEDELSQHTKTKSLPILNKFSEYAEDDDIDPAILSYSPPPKSTRRPLPLTELSQPPDTPLKPSSRFKVPRSPHRENDIAIWDEQDNASWIDQHTCTNSKILVRGLFEPPSISQNPPRSPKKFSEESQNIRKKKQFLIERETLAKDFIDCFSRKICPEFHKLLSSPVEILWSKTLCSTAGRASYSTSRRLAKIELSCKVIDSEVRLRSTLAHEMCHLLVWCIDGTFTNPHGKEFKQFGKLVERRIGIKVETTHTYEISYKYQWQCTGCAKVYQRHSKSIDPTKSVCSICRSRLEQILPRPRVRTTPGKVKGGNPDRASPSKAAGLQRYEAYRKANIERIKALNPGLKYAELIKLVVVAWKEEKERRMSEPAM